MSAPFVSQLRSRPGIVRLVAEGAPHITVRVQSSDVWDVLRIEAAPTEPVIGVKVAAMHALLPDADFHEDFVLKLNGFEVLDENASLAEAGAVDGSSFILLYRRRRPVR